MNEDYLWNRTGEPDPETARLEQLLGALKYEGTVRPRRSPKPVTLWLAAAAVLLLGFLTLPVIMRGPVTNWQLADGRRLRSGQVVETAASEKVKIQSNDTGEITVDPNSRLQLIAATDREQHFDLRHGVIHALIWAPPGRFVVDTPSSKTIDLGCRYTLRVEKNGTGLLTVELGWVAFERNGIESFIPAGAACSTRPDRGPGTPYFTDASQDFTDALARFDSSADQVALDVAITAARRRDALSLWHLMVRTQGEQRARVFDRLGSLVTLPQDVAREAVVRGDSKAIDAAWNALDLGNTDWWREWKSRW